MNFGVSLGVLVSLSNAEVQLQDYVSFSPSTALTGLGWLENWMGKEENP